MSNENAVLVAATGDYIKLKVINQENAEVNFKVKLTTPMSKLKKSYGDRQGVSIDSFRFLFDGKRLADDDTPQSLEMEDGDVIDVFSEMIGGKQGECKMKNNY